VRELVEQDVALLAPGRLRRNRQNPGDAAAGGVGLERKLRLRVHDEPLLVGDRQLVEGLTRDEDLLLRLVLRERHEHRGVPVPEVAPRQRLQRRNEGEAHLPALGDPPEAAAVLQECDLVGLKHDGFTVVVAQPADEPRLGGEPISEVVLCALDDAERHAAAPARIAEGLAFPAAQRLHVSGSNHEPEARP
jgi:hypothetical protein